MRWNSSTTSERLHLSTEVLGLEDLLLGSLRALLLLLLELEDLLHPVRGGALYLLLDFEDQELVGRESIRTLLPMSLATHLDTRQTMTQHDTARGLIHLLSPAPCSTNKLLRNILRKNTKLGSLIKERNW